MSSVKTYFTINHDIAHFISTNHLNSCSLNKICSQFCQQPQNQTGFKTGRKKKKKKAPGYTLLRDTRKGTGNHTSVADLRMLQQRRCRWRRVRAVRWWLLQRVRFQTCSCQEEAQEKWRWLLQQ